MAHAAHAGLAAICTGLLVALVPGGCRDGDDEGEGLPPVPEGVLAVDAGAPAGGDGLTWQAAFRHPQDAVDAAVAGEEVWVAGGAYTRRDAADTVVLTMKDGVAIYGGFGGSETVLDGEGVAYHVVVAASDARLEGLTLTGGNATGVEPDNFGGGMFTDFVADLTVANCVFEENHAVYGGGVHNNGAGSDPTGCSFVDCVFRGNSATWGGGMCNHWFSADVTGCTFEGNSAVDGGGMCSRVCNSAIERCRFIGNSADYGGGMHNDDSRPVLTNCLFAGNSASAGGGGIDGLFYASARIVNCTFAGNSAEYGGGIQSRGGSAPEVVGCILRDDLAGTSGPEIYDDPTGTPGSTTVTYSCVGQAGYTDVPADCNISDDPLFVDASGGDYRLSAGSPCIDTADPAAALTEDIDAAPRPAGSGFDMGAYEYQP